MYNKDKIKRKYQNKHIYIIKSDSRIIVTKILKKKFGFDCQLFVRE